MKIGIYLEEFYPVICFDDNYFQYEVDIDEDLIGRAKNALLIFKQTQDELIEILSDYQEKNNV